MVAIKNPNRKAADAFGEILNAISTWLFGIVYRLSPGAYL